jgi:DNA-binding NarL/FixJ family response regulator
MRQERDLASPTNGDSSMQPIVVLLGTSLHFSDQMLRFLGLEFPEVRFERTCNPGGVDAFCPAPSVVVLHEAVPGLSRRVEEIRARLPAAMLAIACSDAATVRRVSPKHPVSMLQLNAQIDVWLSVLRLLLCGQPYVPLDLLRDTGTPTVPNDVAAVPTAETQLTPREMQILPMIARGKQNKTIAEELGLSEHTVKLHTHNIFAKLKVSNRTGAANWYLSQSDGFGNQTSHGK